MLTKRQFVTALERMDACPRGLANVRRSRHKTFRQIFNAYRDRYDLYWLVSQLEIRSRRTGEGIVLGAQAENFARWARGFTGRPKVSPAEFRFMEKMLRSWLKEKVDP